MEKAVIQYGPGTILWKDGRFHRVAVHFRRSNRHRGYLVTTRGDQFWDSELKLIWLKKPKVIKNSFWRKTRESVK